MVTDMESIDKLREYANGCGGIRRDVINGFADTIEAEIADRYVALPLDADGVPIRVGDVMDNTHKDGFKAKRVIGICLHDGGEWTVEVDEERLRWHRTDKLRHHAPTVEDVLREFANDIADVLGGDDFKLDGNDELFAEFAAKLQLREGE